ncbi:MAG: ferritin family protein [Spirochaetales bacterium]|nr:ferritin family protein [Spirochaetales bacterium]
MSILLSGEEVFSLAKEIEKSGEAYYKTIAASTDSKDLKELFEHLAEQEVRHFHYFDRLSREYPEFTIDAEEWEQTSAYIKATTDSRFFVGEDKAISLARKTTDPLEAIDIAIGFEKDTLLFFYELLNVTPASSKQAARDIVEEEKRHVQLLSERKQRLIAAATG